MIEVKRNGSVFYTIEDLCEGSKMSRQIMDHHYIVLKFTTAEPIYFEIGDSVALPDFGYFELTSAYFPTYNDTTGGYDYEMQMDADYMAWQNKICKYRPAYGANETSFKLTSTIGVHLGVILSNIKALGFKHAGKEYSVDYITYNNNAFDVNKRFYIEYSSTSILDALNTICSEDNLDCEWWVEDSIIYLGYCEMKGQTTFEQGVNMASMSQSESKSSYITRLYAFGSDRNIPDGYFTGSDADVTTDGIATDYLMLPNQAEDADGFVSKNGYLENVNVVKNDKQAIEGVAMFDDEYPKVECIVSDIKTYQSTTEDEDGDKVTQTFWQVTSNDSFATRFEQSWIQKGLNIYIKFTSGALNGMEFECSYKIINQVNYFEVVANDTYGRTLPDKALCPKVGDEFLLYNWDASKITETNLIQDAQLSLLESAKEYYQKSMIDNSNFTCVLDGEKFYNGGTYNFHPLGEQVKLINPMFSQVDESGKHYRNSRIIGMEINLDIPYDEPTYTVGEKASASRLGDLEEKVDSITVNGLQIGTSGSKGGVYIIGTNDFTPATDSNVYSARRTRLEFLSKIYDDVAKGFVQFLSGISIGGDKLWGIAKDGASKLKSLLVRDELQVDGSSQLGANGTSTNFGNYIADSTGATIKVEEDGTSYIEADYLSIRRAADFREITIRELRYIGGELAITPAAMQVCKVERLDADMNVLTDESAEATYFKCYFETTDANGKQKLYQEFVAGDQARCQQFGISQGTSEFVKTKYYWRLVSAVGEDYIVLSNKYGEKDAYTTSEPDVNDNIVQLGYQGAENLPNRQSAIILSATANDAPSQKYYEGIDDFSLDHVVKDEGYDKVSQSFHCNIYGNSYTGDKNHQSYFRYDAATQTASFSGTAHFDSASTKDGNEIATIPDLENLRTKSGNLLRNTSFCGSYESINVQGDTDITEGKETFSESVEYWSLTDCTIQDDAHSESGKSVLIEGTLSQVLEKPLTADGDYTLSFRGCGRKVVISVGGQTITQELQADYNRYEIHFACKDASELSFMITSEYATICEMMLTYGTLASEWSPAYADNDKSMAEFQSLKYLTDAITEGSTTIDGGLVMSQLIKVGNYRDRKMVQETGGMSGFYNDDDSAFLWGGGTMTQALYTIQTYKSDPTYQASDDEVANMAKFVVTHGGRAILNDIILRGYIYAEGGILKSVKSPNGSFAIDDSGDASFTSGTIGDFTLKNGYLTSTATDGSATYTMSLQKDYLNFTGTDERYATIGRFTNEGMKLMLKLIDDCPRTVETSYVATIAARGSKAQNVAIHFGGGCIEGVNYRNQVIGYNTYSSSTIPTLQETLGREVGCVVATTICYKSASGSVTTMYHDVEITMPSVYWYDDGHSILFKRFEGANNKITLKAGTFTELTNAETGATTTYNTCFISDRGTFSTELQLESVMDSFDLRFFRGLSAWIGTNKYVGVWVQFKHPRDW